MFEIIKINSPNVEIKGYYFVDGDYPDAEKAKWTWNNSGNGLQITTQGVWGPYTNRLEALEYHLVDALRVLFHDVAMMPNGIQIQARVVEEFGPVTKRISKLAWINAMREYAQCI